MTKEQFRKKEIERIDIQTKTDRITVTILNNPLLKEFILNEFKKDNTNIEAFINHADGYVVINRFEELIRRFERENGLKNVLK